MKLYLNTVSGLNSKCNRLSCTLNISINFYCLPAVIRILNTLCDTGGDDFVPVQESALKKMPSIKRCVLEAIRLHAPGMITRKVVKTHTINVSHSLSCVFVLFFFVCHISLNCITDFCTLDSSPLHTHTHTSTLPTPHPHLHSSHSTPTRAGLHCTFRTSANAVTLLES